MKRDRSRAKERTRKAILDAAAALLARNPAATMGEIAEAAKTVRSTVHRHFAERADLIAALRAYAEEQLSEAATRAKPHEGNGAEVLLRLCQEYFDRSDLLMGAYGGLTQAEDIESMASTDTDLHRLVERGHSDGSIDRSLSGVWVEQTLWSLLYAAWLLATAGKATRHEALTLFLQSFAKLLSPSDSQASGVIGHSSRPGRRSQRTNL